MTRRTKRVGLIISLVAAMMVVSTSVVLGAGLTITSFTPGTGGAGDSVVITGSGFTGATSVKFGTAEATFDGFGLQDHHHSAGDPTGQGQDHGDHAHGQGECSTPVHPTGCNQADDHVVPPTTVSTGTSVVITGTHFAGASGVTFGGVDAASTSIRSADHRDRPRERPCQGQAHGHNPRRQGHERRRSSQAGRGQPDVASFTPTTSGTGSAVVITGTHFTGATGVRFGTAAATFHVDSDTQITAIVPLTAPDKTKIKVTTPAGSVKSATAWVKGDCQCNTGGGTPALITVTPSSAQPGIRCALTAPVWRTRPALFSAESRRRRSRWGEPTASGSPFPRAPTQGRSRLPRPEVPGGQHRTLR